ncbi:MAG: arsenic resistance N-acetyltransferase ArsN2 [Cyclobacteriaceae bacterium]|nr:arsenic resistance N-acetyltransferase ArsN2 [Cyclobacteriaceae bacterium]MDH4295202.1 arsenic resistance N-acetyltransferase ArsN2 [Cyclobacteriaceae bacterium]MDH5248908.1 arsenic resistance N-acetyltransferase ArsN2 [Cyclobacteriaceae bacterium]
MELTLKTISDEEGFQAFCSLLQSSDLPSTDLDFHKDLLVGYVEDGVMVGTGGLEIYGEFGLLRSLSVKLGTRGKALGTAITEYLIEQARKKNLKGIYLLTETAHGFFQRKGFQDVAREDVPEPLKASSEFSYVCGPSAVAMHLPIL